MTKEELTENLKKLKLDLQKASEEVLKGKEKNTSKIRKLRKEIARVLTSLKKETN